MKIMNNNLQISLNLAVFFLANFLYNKAIRLRDRRAVQHEQRL